MLALLLENVGADKAVRLGNASTWRGAVAALNEEHWLQQQTDTIVRRLRSLVPDRPLHPWFLQIVRQETGKEFTTADNNRWSLVTRPIVEAFFTRDSFSRWPSVMPRSMRLQGHCPSGYAALLFRRFFRVTPPVVHQ